MALHQRDLTARENIVPLHGIKNGLKNSQSGLRAVLASRSANVALPSNTGARALKLRGLSEARQAVAQCAAKPEAIPTVPFELQLIPRVSIPEDITDIDVDDIDHLEFSAVYVKEIYEYLFRIETKYPVMPQYLQKHPTLRPHMRMILVEWLVSLQARFKLLQETLLLTVSILDRFMSATPLEVSRGKFQLVGVAAMLVACKYEEMYLPSVADFAYMCDGAYTTEHILHMERTILETLQFEFAKPLSAHFLRRFSKAGGADSLTHTVAKYFLELALYDYNLVQVTPSKIAAASLYIAGRVTDVVEWDSTLKFYSRYSLSDLSTVIPALAELGCSAAENKYLKTTLKKYSADKFQRVARSVMASEAVKELANRVNSS